MNEDEELLVLMVLKCVKSPIIVMDLPVSIIIEDLVRR